MLWVYGHYKYVYFYSGGIDFSRHAESDVYRRNILTAKVDLRAVRDKTHLIRWFKKNMRNCKGCSRRYTYTLLHQILT